MRDQILLEAAKAQGIADVDIPCLKVIVHKPVHQEFVLVRVDALLAVLVRFIEIGLHALRDKGLGDLLETIPVQTFAFIETRLQKLDGFDQRVIAAVTCEGELH